MGAQKKCQLLLGSIFAFLFCLFLLYSLLNDYIYTETEKNKNKKDEILWLSIVLITSCFLWIYLLYKTLKRNIKLILISKQKLGEENINNINNINNDIDHFIKRTEYKFTKTSIKKNFCGEKKIKKKITCISIIPNNKILLGFSEGTIMLCSLEKNLELKQIFSFNKFKEKKIGCICPSLKYKDEFMISIKANTKVLKLVKLNLEYKYSLIKTLARDKAYLILKEFDNKNWKNVVKIISFENGKFLVADRKGIYVKEKINEFNLDDENNNYCCEYKITKEFVVDRESNDEIYDVLKSNEDSFVTLERKNSISNLHFYKLNTLEKDINYIPNIITSNSLSNRLCYINHFLISIFDSNNVYIINTVLKQKIKTIKLDNIQKSGIDLFFDKSIIIIKHTYINGNKIPHIVKIKKNCGIEKRKEKEYTSYSVTNILQEFKNEEEKKEFISSKIKIIKCLKHEGILIMSNSKGKLFIWEGINKNNENIKLNNLY